MLIGKGELEVKSEIGSIEFVVVVSVTLWGVRIRFSVTSWMARRAVSTSGVRGRSIR